MTISSMTGFARADGASDGLTWAWEARSVNGRGLDVRLRLPPGFDAIEPPAREAIARRFTRGNIAVTLTLEKQASAAALRLNEQVLADILKAAERVAALAGGARPGTAELLAMRGVLEPVDAAHEDQETRARREAALLSSLDTALERLLGARRAEGSRLADIVKDRVAEIACLTEDVRRSPSRKPDAIRQRLGEMIARLLEASDTFDKERLHQEAVLAATRADVEEELARLDAHVAAVDDIMSETGPVGRKLDFLAQEFNREANTLCSKANAVDVTRLGLTLKAAIDQLREQVANIE